MNNSINPYTIYWFSLIPLKGVAPLSDQKIIKGSKFGLTKGSKEVCVHSPNKERAIAKLNSLAGKLSKQYRAYLYTDKQFGMRTYNSDVTAILTTKQKEESFLIN